MDREEDRLLDTNQSLQRLFHRRDADRVVQLRARERRRRRPRDYDTSHGLLQDRREPRRVCTDGLDHHHSRWY